jgi:hypothetical protein
MRVGAIKTTYLGGEIMALKFGLLRKIGARAGDTLIGVKPLNRDLRVQIDLDQKADEDDNS